MLTPELSRVVTLACPALTRSIDRMSLLTQGRICWRAISATVTF